MHRRLLLLNNRLLYWLFRWVNWDVDWFDLFLSRVFHFLVKVGEIDQLFNIFVFIRNSFLLIDNGAIASVAGSWGIGILSFKENSFFFLNLFKWESRWFLLLLLLIKIILLWLSSINLFRIGFSRFDQECFLLFLLLLEHHDFLLASLIILF